MLEAQKRPFYAFLVTLSSHYPFGFPELLKAAAFDQGDEAEGAILRSYLAAIHYFDREFGKFIDGLKSSGLYDESVIILYGDHARDTEVGRRFALENSSEKSSAKNAAGAQSTWCR